MTSQHDLERAAPRCDDQPGALQRRGTARGPRRRHHATELHYVRSNFAVPEHDGTLEIGGAVEQPDRP